MRKFTWSTAIEAAEAPGEPSASMAGAPSCTTRAMSGSGTSAARSASGSSATKARSSVVSPACRRYLLRGAGGDDAPAIHRGEPVEALGLLHIGGGDDDAHAGPAARACPPSVPRTAGGTADRCRWSARPSMTRSGSWISAAQMPSFCFMPPESLPAGARRNAARPVAGEQFVDAGAAFLRAQPEQPAEEVEVLRDAQRRMEVRPSALRHVGDAGTDGAARGCLVHVLAEHMDACRAGSG